MERTIKLAATAVEKPWGRYDLPPAFRVAEGRQIGEIWFEEPAGGQLPLLAKYLFTAERLSVQVHPSDAQAQEAGDPNGKTECWYVVDAEPDARIGIGFTRPITPEEAQAAALDGSIEQMLAWRTVAAGDFVYVPAGTVHAIGAGLTIIELQQNSNLTYRLFDYGRGRSLHLDDGFRVANLTPAEPSHFQPAAARGDRVLVSARQFTVVQATTEVGARMMEDRKRWVLPVSGSVEADDQRASAGECLLVPSNRALTIDGGSVALIAAAGALA